ncbi:hypothetical protein [Vibrio sp. WXL210]|uniref:hypothetical protein n=1 Tax=Vibrio sp. WXL210 TaxID=3450709 RepID=UPI003EC8CD80
MKQTPITSEQYQALVANTQQLKRKFVRLNDQNQVIKIHKPRRLTSSARIFPLAKRFVKGVERLESKGFRAPNIVGFYRQPELRYDVLVYDLAQGETVWDKMQSGDNSHLPQMAQLLAQLHTAGVFFGDFHFDNVVENQGQYTLIDIDSVRTSVRPLTMYQRARNLMHLIHKKESFSLLEAYGQRRFIEEYMRSCRLSGLQAYMFYRFVQRRWKGPLGHELTQYFVDSISSLHELIAQDIKVLTKKVIFQPGNIYVEGMGPSEQAGDEAESHIVTSSSQV